MSVGDAKKFINLLMASSGFRNRFLKIITRKKMDDFLTSYKLCFDDNDFEDGLNNLLLNCQHEALANQYHQVKYIYETVMGELVSSD